MMQREITDKVFLGNTVFPYHNAGRSSAINRTASNYNETSKKRYKKLGSSSKQVDMTKILPHISLAYLSLNFKGCSKTLTRGKNQPILPIVTWNNWTFRFY